MSDEAPPPKVVADQEASAHLDLSAGEVQDPPTTLWAAFKMVGPGLVLAASIVGTGELIATTSLGAKAGFALLWLILLSCVIKVFVQIELGRLAIVRGQTTLAMLDGLPGPRLGASWLCWVWLIMMLTTQAQIGAMEGLIGQAASMAFPNASAKLARWTGVSSDMVWAAISALAAIGLLLSGSYKRLERVTTVLVGLVTFFTVAWVVGLQFTDHAITGAQVASGLSFAFPAGAAALALTAFGITGVGASELYAYPYWCLEKGYARATGPRDQSKEWATRARGWLKVMKLDAWFSMGVFTVATVSFYLLGAAVLGREEGELKGKDMIARLSQMYAGPLKGTSAEWLVPGTVVAFLIGAWAVLFKTLYVATAGNARLTADFLGLVRGKGLSQRGTAKTTDVFHVVYPLLALGLYVGLSDPAMLVKMGGTAQALTLPIIAGATLALRYRDKDERVRPSRTADVMVWLAFFAVTGVAVWALWGAW